MFSTLLNAGIGGTPYFPDPSFPGLTGMEKEMFFLAAVILIYVYWRVMRRRKLGQEEYTGPPPFELGNKDVLMQDKPD